MLCCISFSNDRAFRQVDPAQQCHVSLLGSLLQYHEILGQKLDKKVEMIGQTRVQGTTDGRSSIIIIPIVIIVLKLTLEQRKKMGIN